MQRAGYPVYLNIYDFTTCNGCLEPLGLGAYHTGLEIQYPAKDPATPNTATAWCPQTPTSRESSKSIPKVRSTDLSARCTWERP